MSTITLTYYQDVPVTRPRAIGEVITMPFSALGGHILDAATDTHEKGSAGYWVAAPVHGPRSNASAQPTNLIALDYDDSPTGPNWKVLGSFKYFAHTTDSHSEAAPRWRVWVELDRAYDRDEVARARVPVALAGAHLRAISQPVYVPTRGDDLLWQENLGGAARPLVLAAWWPEPTPGPAAPTPGADWTPPARRLAPSRASTNALVTRWLTRPEGTNRLAGALGAALAEWGWEDEEVSSYVEAWFGDADPRWRKHADDAVRGARKRRAGDRIVGFPTLAEELGQAFEPDAPAGLVAERETIAAILAAAEEPAPPAPATAAGPGPAGEGWTTAADVAAWDPPPVPWLVEALGVAPGAPTLLTGYGGSGKTTFAQHLAVVVATPGTFLLGDFRVRHGAVTHLDYEQGRDLTMRRYQRLGLEADAQLRFRSAPPHYLADPSDADARAWFVRACVGQALVVVDSLVASAGAGLDDENATNIREPLDFFGRVSEATGAVVLVVHHSKKDRTNGRTSARGSSAITDAVSCHLTYEKEDEEGPRGAPRLAIQKLRHEAPAGLVWEPFRVGVAPRGPAADGGYTLVVGDTDEAVANAKADRLETEVVSLLATGWSGSANDLVKQLGRRKIAVLETVQELIQNGIIEKTSGRLQLVVPSIGNQVPVIP